MISTSTPTPTPIQCIIWPARVENPPPPIPAYLPNALNTLLADRLSISSVLDAVKAHMHVQHKHGPKSKKYVKPHITQHTKNWPRKAVSRESKLILEKCKCHRWRKKSHALLHRFDMQPKACRSVQPHDHIEGPLICQKLDPPATCFQTAVIPLLIKWPLLGTTLLDKWF